MFYVSILCLFLMLVMDWPTMTLFWDVNDAGKCFYYLELNKMSIRLSV